MPIRGFVKLDISEWIDIQDKFIEKFGHDKGINIMHNAIKWIHMSKKLKKRHYVNDFDYHQDEYLKTELRTMWKKYAGI